MKGLMSSLVALLDIAPGRVLASLGLGFVSFAAIQATVTAFINNVASYWNNITGLGLQFASMAGFDTGLGIVMGAIIARVSLSALPKIGKIT